MSFSGPRWPALGRAWDDARMTAIRAVYRLKLPHILRQTIPCSHVGSDAIRRRVEGERFDSPRVAGMIADGLICGDGWAKMTLSYPFAHLPC